MTRRAITLVGCMVLAVALRAQDNKFSQEVRAGDFTAAGLNKLSPEELARLDQLVQAYKSGALAAAKREAEEAASAKAAAEARAAKAEADAKAAQAREAVAVQKVEETKRAAKPTEAKTEKESGNVVTNLLSRAKVVLTPGTEIEYETVSTRLLSDFQGWHAGTVFVLENGQRWQVVSNESYVTPPEKGPKAVKIIPGAFGTFFLEIEGVRVKPRIKIIIGTTGK